MLTSAGVSVGPPGEAPPRAGHAGRRGGRGDSASVPRTGATIIRGMDPDSRPFARLTLAEFSERLGSDAPVPGGGSASAVAASMGASLVAMVAQLSRRGPLAQHAAVHELA